MFIWRINMKASAPMVYYTTVVCDLGFVGIAATAKGVCFVGFDDDESRLEKTLHAEFAGQILDRDDVRLRDMASGICRQLAGKPVLKQVAIDAQGTPFQQRVWGLLRDIPSGETRSYRQLAGQLGQINATRAVARACATNPVSLLTPCHRVVRSDGGLAGFRWGIERKQKLLDTEKNRE